MRIEERERETMIMMLFLMWGVFQTTLTGADEGKDERDMDGGGRDGSRIAQGERSGAIFPWSHVL
jgi:hypothetical protein